MNDKIDIGIKNARESKGISIIELATLLKVDPRVIIGWESGAAFPPLDTLIEISNILATSTDMLLFSENRKPLDISKLTTVQKDIVKNLYEKIKVM